MDRRIQGGRGKNGKTPPGAYLGPGGTRSNEGPPADSRRSELRERATRLLLCLACVAAMSVGGIAGATEEALNLDDLVSEGLANNPEILAAQAKAQAAVFRIPQAKSLPDPMFMFGYQNEGFERITIDEASGSQGMLALSQQFYFPGKRAIKGEMASKNAESLLALYEGTRHRVTAQIKMTYYDLLLAYETIDILDNRTELFARIEDAASSRYASGTGTQQEVLMAQTEKYMIFEKEEMQRQKIQALQGMLNATMGRDATSRLGRPARPAPSPFDATLDDVIRVAEDHSPDVRSKRKAVEEAQAKVRMAQKEYYPDFTISAGYFPRGGDFPPMWNLTATVNLPVFYRAKQRQALAEAQAQVIEARRELTAMQLMVASNVRDRYSVLRSSERLMRLYDEGVIRKVSQDVQLAFSNYVAGKSDALTVITRIQSLLDYEVLYRNQFVEREKAIARLHELAGGELQESPR